MSSGQQWPQQAQMTVQAQQWPQNPAAWQTPRPPATPQMAGAFPAAQAQTASSEWLEPPTKRQKKNLAAAAAVTVAPAAPAALPPPAAQLGLKMQSAPRHPYTARVKFEIRSFLPEPRIP
jgi:hypothetical protein